MTDNPVIYRFRNRGTIPGIKARDLTQRDFDRLSLEHQRDVRAGTLYEAVGDVPELPRNTEPDFDSMTKAQLVEHAEAHGIAGVDPNATKAEIVAAVKGGE